MKPHLSILIFPLLSCSSESSTDAGDTGQSAVSISGPEWFTRASLDARGTRPSLEELATLPEDEEALSEAVAQLADSESLGERLAWLWNERVHSVMWASQVERFDVYDGEAWTQENAEVAGLEVLQFLRLLVDEDRSLRELVTVQGVPVRADSPAHWPTTGGGTEWSWGSYTDDRPVSGVLSSPAMWLRYTDDALNYHRYRANALSKIFLCRDFFDKPAGLDFSFDATESSIEDAVKTEPACLSCHASLDPLGAHFGGFSEKSINFSSESFLSYSAFNDSWTTSITPPAYFGHKSSGIESLGEFIAADPRFSRCMVETIYEGLAGLEFSEEPEADALVALFRDAELKVRPLVRAILQLPSYRSRPERLLTNAQLRSSWMQLLSVEADHETRAILDSLVWDPELGVMGGAGDDVDILIPSREATLSRAVLLEWAAKSVARDVLEQETLRDLSSQQLLGVELPVPESELPDLFAHWLNLLTSRSLSPDSEEVERVVALYTVLAADPSAEQFDTLAKVLEALLQHPMGQVY